MQWPVYPEPPALQTGSYVLDPRLYASHLPTKFRHVLPVVSMRGMGGREVQRGEVVRVHFDGRLTVEEWDSAKHGALALQVGRGYRWSLKPWTEEMERSCRPFRIRVRGWNQAT